MQQKDVESVNGSILTPRDLRGSGLTFYKSHQTLMTSLCIKMSSETLSALLSRGKATVEGIVEFLVTHDPPGAITKQAAARLLSIIGSAKSGQELAALSKMLLLLSKSEPVVNQLVAGSDRALSATLDRMLSYALNESRDMVASQEMIVVVFDMIGISDKLKSQLGFTIHEYVLGALEKGKLGSDLVSKSMELLVSAVTHHPENRTKYVKNTSKERIKKVFDFLFQTGNPMAEIFAVEFLWRVAVPMRLNANDKQFIFGPMADDLYSITAEAFRDGILNFVQKVNRSRTDENRVIQFQVKDLMIGDVLSTGEHTAYVGNDTILFWIKKSAFHGMKPDIELVSISKHETEGVGQSMDKWVVKMTDHFDTLPSFFEEASKMIVFKPLCDDKETIFTVMRQRFNQIDVDELPRPRKEKQESTAKKTVVPQTPKPHANVTVHNPKTRAMTPRVQMKNPEPQQTKAPPAKVVPQQTPTIARLPPKGKRQLVDSMSSDSESDGFFMPPDLSPERKRPSVPAPPSTGEKRVDTPRPVRRTRERDEGELPKQDVPEHTVPKTPKSMFKQPTASTAVIESSTERKIADPKRYTVTPNNQTSDVQVEAVAQDFDHIPTMSISQSYQSESDSDSDSPPGRISPKAKGQVTISQAPVKKTLPAQRREYTPEKWEMETFDELKAFGSAIREKLAERKTMLIRSVEDSVIASCKEITTYMEQCDSGLDQLRSDFMTQSVQFSKDIKQKQKMVEELGLQQTEHIEQMVKDCEVIQKRAEEQMKRLNNQVKNMLANQEKHIALFREDMRSEVRAVVTSRKRESSKRIVQQLVTLLDEL